MAKNPVKNQSLTHRTPRQARALGKVELIFEAAIRILERDGLAALNTNRVAELAGISIGTLYQYFPHKAAIMDALAERELNILATTVMAALTGPPPDRPGARVRPIIRVILDAYGGRPGANRLLMQHALSPGASAPLRVFRESVQVHMATDGVVAHDGRVRRLSEVEAFMLAQAFVSVLRGLLEKPAGLTGGARQEAEDALTRLVWTFMENAVDDR
jgi:AcrR family transcriptional regulator